MDTLTFKKKKKDAMWKTFDYLPLRLESKSWPVQYQTAALATAVYLDFKVRTDEDGLDINCPIDILGSLKGWVTPREVLHVL